MILFDVIRFADSWTGWLDIQIRDNILTNCVFFIGKTVIFGILVRFNPGQRWVIVLVRRMKKKMKQFTSQPIRVDAQMFSGLWCTSYFGYLW